MHCGLGFKLEVYGSLRLRDFRGILQYTETLREPYSELQTLSLKP